MKLNYKRTVYIGFAFFAILMLWQVYNTYCPLILTSLLEDKFGEGSKQLTYVVGIIMASDNLFALFMLPLFGHLSDKTKTKYGRRMPYIVIGMFLSCMLFPLIAVSFILGSLVGVVIMMGVILIIMNAYRNPAVSLMPDVTPKPLRSTANGIINLIGYIGAIIAGGIAMILKKPETYLYAFIIASVFMLIAMIIVIVTIKENKILEEVKDDLIEGEKYSQSLEEVKENTPLSKRDRINLSLLLGSILFWFISFNAVETYASIYCKDVLGDNGIAGLFVIVLTVSSILTFATCSTLANRLGRKLTILIGLASIIFGFLVVVIYTYTPLMTSGLFFIVLLAMVFMGIGWGLININSYPMIVEMAHSSNVGKYTGKYYTFSMIGQTLTPVVLGLIVSFTDFGIKFLFVYSLVTMVVALIIFSFVKERTKPNLTKKSFLESVGEND